ncbi:NTP transferase domain-containing protein [Nocardia terpenica]|nr:NTP transferase domain-containing protein [Nocardia terpenica]MBF6063236.1 NTP transferase domain-containing protein [Nocardia terpenica]MBF6105792.1 NTP transferase domain-containing protein [Nocardia terpenica]MBF6113624.1 NTP transferase domain-containing protein [Nocardia terpenica]MBF6119533.1 NTP transferase domain-containing protein [Nocardia terpenica]MBF6151944.1 NTP transferase domain-containing protein [Nocardia terpenica]
MITVDAIVLAGGRATRMGGVDKPGIVIGGQSMLDAALSAVASCTRTVVVGPHRPGLGPQLRQVQEVPAGSGPVAAIATGLRALDECDFPADLVVVLAADLPFLTVAAVDELIGHATESGADAVFAADESGRPQYLVGVWRRTALLTGLERLDSLVNQPMKALVPVGTMMVPLPGAADCDTPDDVRRARANSAPLALDEARSMLRRSISRLPARQVTLRSAPGAALAAPLTAVEALPRFDVSAMDGYAVAGDGPWRLRHDVGFAGGRRPVGLLAGEAVRIATGAHVPEGTGAVVRDEFVRVDADGLLHRLPDSPIRDDVRRRGEDWQPGDVIAPEGTPVSAALLSAATAAEVAAAAVRGPVRARIVMTGDEIRSEGPLHTGQTRDSLGPVLPDLLSRFGIHPLDRVHLRDTPNGFDEVLSAAVDCELLVIVGATGGGAADQLRDALDRTNARILVHRLRLRPGGSTVVAETGGGTVVLGLPGNPFAAVATLLALSPAIVDGLTGRIPARNTVGPLHNASEISGPVSRIVPARAVAEGGWIGDPNIRTAHLAGLLHRDGLVVVPAGATDGTRVEFLPLPG